MLTCLVPVLLFTFYIQGVLKLKKKSGAKRLIIDYGIIIKSISTITCTVWHVDKYNITFKLVINCRRISRGPV